jgi:hypothetical protein
MHRVHHLHGACVHVPVSVKHDSCATPAKAGFLCGWWSSYVDALVLVGFFAPCGVAKAGVATLPMIGAITRGLQFLFVTRSGTTGKALEAWAIPRCMFFDAAAQSGC